MTQNRDTKTKRFTNAELSANLKNFSEIKNKENLVLEFNGIRRNRKKQEISLLTEINPDMNALLQSKIKNAFLIRVSGDSMKNAGITDGCYLIVNPTISPDNNSIVIAEINKKLVVKKIRFVDDRIELLPENSDFEPIKINKKDDFHIWGVVTSVINSF
jgi:SOS-response transcriptional repressor LexA